MRLSLFLKALDLWPDLAQPLSKAMLKALCQKTGLPGDVPLNELSGLQQRVLFEGTVKMDQRQATAWHTGARPMVFISSKGSKKPAKMPLGWWLRCDAAMP